MTRSFLADDDLSPAEQAAVLDLAAELKRAPYAAKPLAGPLSVATIYDKPTLRTQVSFAAGIAELGGHAMLVDGTLAGIGKRESVADVARVLGRQAAAIVWRTYGQDAIEEMAAYSGVPVVNALTDEYHPCQLLADLLTVQGAQGHARRADGRVRRRRRLQHGQLLAAGRRHRRDARAHQRARGPGARAGHGRPGQRHRGGAPVAPRCSSATRSRPSTAPTSWSPTPGSRWARRARPRQRLLKFADYTVTAELMAHAAPEAIVMHCLPAYRGKEIDADVLDGPQSVVWDEAENRRHAQKAIITWLLQRGEQP